MPQLTISSEEVVTLLKLISDYVDAVPETSSTSAPELPRLRAVLYKLHMPLVPEADPQSQFLSSPLLRFDTTGEELTQIQTLCYRILDGVLPLDCAMHELDHITAFLKRLECDAVHWVLH